MRPPLHGRRDAARRLVDGLRRTVAETIAPPERGDAEELPGAGREPLREAGSTDDSDARLDAARERLRSTVAPRDEDDADPS